MATTTHQEPAFVRPKPQRADARRNYEAIVAAAREAFARDGVTTSIDDIARSAGVGSATLYRHFPTRNDLVVAAITENMVTIHRRGVELLTAADTFTALREWLLAEIDQVSTYGGLPASVLDAATEEGTALGVTCASMQALTARLLRRAKRAGTIRRDVTADELFDLANGVAWIVSRRRPADGGARLLDLLLEGVRPTSAGAGTGRATRRR